MTTATNPPLRSPEQTPDQPPREIRARGRLRIVKRDVTSSLLFFLSETEYMELELRSAKPQGAHETGVQAQGEGPLPPSWTGCGPPGLHLLPAFFIFSETCLRGFSGHSENFCFLHMKQHHGNSAENSVSPGQLHSNHASQSQKQGQKCLEKQIRWRCINSPKLKPLLVLKQFS